MADRGKIFNEVPILAPKRSWFDMSFDNELSCNIGELIPTMCMECLPGDIIKQKSSHFGRLMPLVSPVMGKLNVMSYHFFVRMRDIWPNWDKFITNNDQKKTWQQNVSSFVPPTMPFYKMRKLLYNGRFSPSSTMYNATNGSFDTRLETNTYKLVFWYDAVDSSWKYYFTRHMPYFLPPTSQVVFFFTPEREDVDRVDNVHTAKPSPFGISSLFDYLGVHVGDIYKDQYDYSAVDPLNPTPIVSFIEDLLGISNFPVTFNNAIPGYYGGQLYSSSGNSPYFGPDQLDKAVEYTGSWLASTTLKDFLESRCLQAVFVNESTTPKVGAINMSGGTQGSAAASWALDLTQGDDEISSLPFRAYRFIYDEYFRDENYIEVNPHTNFIRDGDDANFAGSLSDAEVYEYLTLARKAWEHDPYTTALPSAQRGPAVRFMTDSPTYLSSADSSRVGVTAQGITLRYDTSDPSMEVFSSTTGSTVTTSGTQRNVLVDLSTATIENFRWANAMQKYLERKARTGGRYYEYLIGLWNKSVEDAKLNRPIYLSGDKTPVQISEVTQTSSTNVQTAQPLGDLAGRGVTIGSDKYLEYEAPDYGFFIEICCVVPRVQYQQGLKQMFTRRNYLDYPIPDFANLGEEYIKVQELYYRADERDEAAFGYTPRYAGWKYNRDEVHGQLKTTLDHWTFARKFENRPIAGRKFLEVEPSYRQFAVTNAYQDHIILTMWHDIQVNRALPEFGVPIL